MAMSKANRDSSPGVCERIYNAVTGNSALRSIYRKSGGRSQSTKVSDVTELKLHADKPGVTLVPLKGTVVQPKAGTSHVNIEIQSATQKNGEARISPSKIESFGHSGKRDEAKSNTVVLYIEGPEDKAAAKQQGRAPNIPVTQGGGRAVYASPPVRPAKTTPQIPVPVHEKGNAEKLPVHDKFGKYIHDVKNKITTLANGGEHDENPKPAVTERSATRRDSFDDKVANYLHRARNNIRTPSNIGDK